MFKKKYFGILIAVALILGVVQNSYLPFAKVYSEQSDNYTSISSVNATLSIPVNSTSSSITNEKSSKFDQEFEKKINDMINVGERHEYNVIIYLKKVAENGFDAKSIVAKNKDKLEERLRNIHGVTELYKGHTLSFITAKIMLQEIPKLADYDYVMKIGDGEIQTVPLGFTDMNAAKQLVSANNLSINGSGVLAGVIDVGVPATHKDLPTNGSMQKIVQKIICKSSVGCDPSDQNFSVQDHTTRVAGITVGLGLNPDENMRGVAPGAKLLIAQTDVTTSAMAAALDWQLSNGAKAVSVVRAIYASSQCDPTSTFSLVFDEAMDEGLVVNVGVGNIPGQINSIACPPNVIGVGPVDENTDLWTSSSTGSTIDGRLKPELVAPGVGVTTTNGTGSYSADSGSSFSTPFVTAASALLLEAHPEYSPLEVKAALLVGAKWNPKNESPTSQTATEYENGIGNATLNKFGFGLLDINKTLTYANTGKNILKGTISLGQTKQYVFSANQGEQVKVILSWLKHPGGTIQSPTDVQTSNLNFVITRNDNGATVQSSLSQKQNNEFAVFNAPVTGDYTITVSAECIVSPVSTETFVIASTHQIPQTYFFKEGTFTKLASQFARPDADISTGGWTTTPLYQKLDETPADDADFVTSPTGTAPQFEVGLSDVVDPNSSTGHVIKFRAKAPGGGGGAEQANAKLFQGTNLIAQTEFRNLDRNQFMTFTQTLTATEANAITDYNNLSIRIETSKANSETIQVSWIEFEVPPSSTSQTVSGLGFKPEALILYTTGQTSSGFADGYNFAIGFSNGTVSRSIGIASDDAASSSNAGRAFGSKILKIVGSGNPTIAAEADLTSVTNGTFTINWTTNDANPTLIHYVAVGGTNVTNAFVSSFAASTTTGPQSVTGLGFKPDLIVFMHAASTSETSTASNGYMSLGFATSHTKRSSIAVTSEDGRATMDTWALQRTDRAIVGLNPGTGAITAQADLNSIVTDGFILNWKQALSSADRIYYLALKGGQYDVGNFNKTTSSAPVTQSISGIGFQPKGLLLSSFNTVSNTAVQSNNRFSFSATDANNNGTTWAGDSDNVANSITAHSEITNKVIRLATEQASGSSSVTNAEASMQPFSSDGFTLNWSTNDAIAKQILYVAFGGNLDSGSVPSGLAAEWNLDDNALDTSCNSNNGTVNGATFVNGKLGKALSFDGTDDVVKIPNHSTLNFGSTGSFSISVWLKSTQSGFGWIVDHRSNNDGVYSGYTIGDSSGVIIARIRDSTAHDVPVSSTTNVNDNKFHHIVLIVDRIAQTENLYIDNILEDTETTSSVGNIDTSFSLQLGGTAIPNTLVDFFAGTLDQVRIYNRTLTTNEINSLFNER